MPHVFKSTLNDAGLLSLPAPFGARELMRLFKTQPSNFRAPAALERGVARTLAFLGTIRGRILIAFIVMSMITAALGGFAIMSVQRAGVLVEKTFNESLMSINYARAAATDFAAMRATFAQRWITSDLNERVKLDHKVELLLQSLVDDVEIAAKRSQSLRATQAATKVKQAASNWNSVRLRMLSGTEPDIKWDTLEQQTTVVNEEVDLLVNYTAGDAFIYKELARANVIQDTKLNIAGTVIALLFAVVVAWLLARRVIGPVAAASEVAERIADAELDVEIPHGSADELGVLLSAMRRMRDNIKAMMEREGEQRRLAVMAQLRLADALESSREGIVIADSDGCLVLANAQVAGVLGTSPDMLRPGIPIADLRLFPTNFVNGGMTKLFDMQMSATDEMLLADGRWLRVSRNTTHDGGWIIVCGDISELKAQEATLREINLRLDAALENMSQGLMLFDSSERIAVCNRRYIEMYGLSPDVVRPGCSFRDLISHRKETGTFSGDVDQYYSGIVTDLGHGKATETIIETADGRSIRIVNQPIVGGGWVATHEDITERQRLLRIQSESEQLLREQKQLLNAALDNMIQGLCMFDAEGRIVLWNPRYMEMMGLSAENLTGVSLLDICKRRKATGQFVGDPEQFFADVLSAARARRSLTKIVETIGGRALRVVDQPMDDGGWVATFEDITEQTKVERERDRDREFLSQIVDNVPSTIIVKNVHDLRYVLINRAGEEHFGTSRDRLIGKTAAEVLPKPAADLVAEHDEKLLKSDGIQFFDEHPVNTSSKGDRFLTSKRLIIRDGEGEPQYLLGVIDDVTEHRAANARISHLAHYDALTDLPNRVLFREHLEQSLKWVRRGEHLAVLYLDIDQFKSVNDTLGHPIGDELLRAVAARLRACIRETDIVARLGGDEFAIIQTAVEESKDVTELANRIHKALRETHEVAGHQLVADASIGIALAPNDGADPDQLLKNADLAMYRAKADGRGTYRFFEPGMDARMKARRALEFDLREAIMCSQFELHYQPLVNVRDNDVSGFEALLRWRHPKRGPISPVEFIPIAEETGLINQLGEWALRSACAEAATWPNGIKVAVNVSPVQFKSGNIVQMVISALAASRLPAHRLELEITEAVLIRDDDIVLTVLHQLRSLGVRIAMDDFGTGYSSLSYLRRFPFDKIKIDRSFIKDIAEPDGSLAIVQAVISIARSRNITTTAEGVETEPQLELLRTLGCAEIQGYLFSPARPSTEISKFLLSFRERVAAVG